MLWINYCSGGFKHQRNWTFLYIHHPNPHRRTKRPRARLVWPNSVACDVWFVRNEDTTIVRPAEDEAGGVMDAEDEAGGVMFFYGYTLLTVVCTERIVRCIVPCVLGLIAF